MGGSSSKDAVQMRNIAPVGVGKVAIVTGPTGTGIGLHTSRWLAECGYNVILAGRSQERLEKSRHDIIHMINEKQKPDAPPLLLTPLILDTSSLASVERFVQEFEQLNLPLNILINNAGIMGVDYSITPDGFESQMATNHIGHAYLTQLLLPKLRASAPSRVVNVASGLHTIAPTLTSDNLDTIFRPTEQQYGRWTSYGASKLANILHAREFNKRYASEGVTAYSVHPGVVATGLGQHGIAKWWWSVMSWTMKSPERGAGTSVYVATSNDPEVLNNAGKLWDTCVPRKRVSSQGLDSNLAELVWTKTEEEIEAWRSRRSNDATSSDLNAKEKSDELEEKSAKK